MNFKNTPKVVKAATIGSIIYLFCFGVAMAFFPIRPFWNDEWRLTYNLKFKDIHQLWGRLDLLQECPRCYLTGLKVFTAHFNYSYLSLRLPALIIAVFCIFLVFHLMKKLFIRNSIYGYLFILILVSSQTFTDYIVQVKQYEMDIFLCLLAIWQLITLVEISEGGLHNQYKYLLLCFSFLVAPFFSYMYPIAVAPIFVIIFWLTLIKARSKQGGANRVLLYLPLALTAIGIVIFYLIDVRHLMADTRMYKSYYSMLGEKKDENYFIRDFWRLFSLVGSGFLYEIIFGVLGIASFVYGIYRLVKTKVRDYTLGNYFSLYGVLLLLLTLALFLTGKLIGGVARLTVFTVPSISFLIVSFISDLRTKYSYVKPVNIITLVLFIGLYGNIITTCINRFTYREYNNRIQTYWHTTDALNAARKDHIPFLYTDGVRGDIIHKKAPVPSKIATNTITPAQILGTDTVCTEVIVKDYPAYRVDDPIPVYQIPDMEWLKDYMQQLPAQYKSAIACDGIHFFKISR